MGARGWREVTFASLKCCPKDLRIMNGVGEEDPYSNSEAKSMYEQKYCISIMNFSVFGIGLSRVRVKSTVNHGITEY